MDKNNLEAVSAFIYAEKNLPKYYEYEPETVKEELGIDSTTLERILVCHTIFFDHSVFEQYHVFEKAVCVLNGREADFEHHQELSVPEICWGLYCIREIDDTSPFDEEVLVYITSILYEDGFIKVPECIKEEKSVQDITITVLLKNMLAAKSSVLNDIPEIKEQQEAMEKNVCDYCDARKEKLQKELKIIRRKS